MVSGKASALEKIREGITGFTWELTKLGFRGGYPDLDKGLNILRERLAQGVDHNEPLALYIIGTGIGLYIRTAEIFGSPPDPIRFADAYLPRAQLGFEMELIKRQNGEPVQNPEVEYRLRKDMVERAKSQAYVYGLSTDAAASKAGLYVSDAILTRFRGLQELSRSISQPNGRASML